MNCYLFTWSRGAHGDDESIITQDQLVEYFDADKQIINWRTDAGAIFLVTEREQRALRDRIMEKYPGLHFVLVPLETNQYSGFANAKTWTMLRERKPPE